MILSPTTGPRDPMSSSIDNITSTLDNGGSSRFLGGGLSGPSQLFSSAQGFFGAGPIVPTAIEEKAPTATTPGSGPLPLKISNLPRDITDREFKVLFTFAHEFMYAELHKSSSVGDDGLPLSIFGYAYFKSFASASAAQSALDMRSDIFFMGPLKCEIVRDVISTAPTSGSSDTENSVNHSSSYESLRKKGSSRFVFADANAAGSKNGGGYETPEQAKNASSPRSLFPIGSIDGAVAGNDDFSLYHSNGGTSNGNVNGNGQYNMPTHPQQGPGVPPSGKSLLLESRDEDEFNNLVNDPVRFFARDSGFMGFTPSSNGNGGPASATAAPGPPISASTATSPPHQGVLGPPGPPHTSQQQKHASSNSPPSSASSRPTLASIASQGLSTQASSASSSSSASSTASTSPPARHGQTQLTPAAVPTQNQWDKRRSSAAVVATGPLSTSATTPPAQPGSAARQFSQLSISTDKSPPSMPAVSNGGGDPSKVVVPYSPTNNSQAIQIMQNGGRVLPPANPADQNPPCNTLYVGNLPPDTSEDELKDLFASRRGYKRLCFRTKANGPMCFVEFEDVAYAARALEELYGFGLSNSVKGGIRLSFSKNPLGVRGNSGGSGNGGSSNTTSSNGGNNISSNNTSSGNGRYNNNSRYHGSVNYAEAATQGYMK